MGRDAVWKGPSRGMAGPVLVAGEVADAVIDAILRQNPGVTLIDRGSYVRVAALRSCRVGRAAIAEALGRPFVLPGDLERIMPTFVGTFEVNDEEAIWLAPEPPVPQEQARNREGAR